MNNTNIQKYLNHFEGVLREIVSNVKIPAQRLHDALLYSLFSGGKRIRPLLIYLCGEIVNVPIDVLDIIATSLELMHTYSLIHDDLPAMDNDDVRRGLPTCHKKFDEATAILVGDGIQSLAIEILTTKLAGKISDKQIEAAIDKHMMLITPDKIDRFVNTFYVTLNKKCVIVTKDGFEFSDSSINDIKIDAKVMLFSNNVYDLIHILELNEYELKIKFDKNRINYIEDGSSVIISYPPKFLFGTAFR